MGRHVYWTYWTLPAKKNIGLSHLLNICDPTAPLHCHISRKKSEELITEKRREVILKLRQVNRERGKSDLLKTGNNHAVSTKSRR